MMRLGRDTTPEQKVGALDDAVSRLKREFTLAGTLGRGEPIPADLTGDRPSVQ